MKIFLLLAGVIGCVACGPAAIYGLLDGNDGGGDGSPSVTVEDAAVSEGPELFMVSLDFSVSLSRLASEDVVVEFTTSDGTAEGTSDYVPLTGSILIPEGFGAGVISVMVNGDAEAEADETVALTLTSVQGAKIERSNAVGLIINDDAPLAPVLSVGDGGVNALTFSWPAVPFASHYKLFLDAEGTGAFVQVGSDIPAPTVSADQAVSVHLTDWVNALYSLDACNAAGCSSSADIPIDNEMLGAIGFFKSPSVDGGDEYGAAVAISDDATTLVVGAPREDGGIVDVTGSTIDNSESDSGAVYVYAKQADSWAFQAYLKAPLPLSGDRFGSSLGVSSDGSTLAVGAPGDDAGASDSGAVYVFTRAGTSWDGGVKIKACNPRADDALGGVSVPPGTPLAISGDGTTVAAASILEDSDGSATCSAGGANSNEADSGAVFVFRNQSGTWSQEAFIKAIDVDRLDELGFSLSLSQSGNVLAIGAHKHDNGGAPGTGDDEGAVYVYALQAGSMSWAFQDLLKPAGIAAGDSFGASLDLFSPGAALATGDVIVACSRRASEGAARDGRAYLFEFDGVSWVEQQVLSAFNAKDDLDFGRSVALSQDGLYLAVGSLDDSMETGVTGLGLDNGASDSGAAYFFSREDLSSLFGFEAYVKASNTGSGDALGEQVALSADGATLVVGAPGEGSSSEGIDVIPNDNAPSSGAVYVY